MNARPLSLFLLAVLIIAASGQSQAQLLHLVPEAREAILGGPPDSSFTKVSEIPPGAQATLGFRLANPGEEYQETDTIDKPNLLFRRLIWGARKANYLILHYEMGGIGHSYHVVILSKDAHGDFKLIWRPASIRLESYADFYQVLAGRGLDDSADYSP